MNPHDQIRVKLTEAGKRMVIQSHDQFVNRLRSCGSIYRPDAPKWDKDDWMSGVFWSIMANFDGNWRAGADVSFTELETVSPGSPKEKHLSAGKVAPGKFWYEVYIADGHPTLKVGEMVKMVETPAHENLLLRNDCTLHALQDKSGQYVVLTLPEEP